MTSNINFDARSIVCSQSTTQQKNYEKTILWKSFLVQKGQQCGHYRCEKKKKKKTCAQKTFWCIVPYLLVYSGPAFSGTCSRIRLPRTVARINTLSINGTQFILSITKICVFSSYYHLIILFSAWTWRGES